MEATEIHIYLFVFILGLFRGLIFAGGGGGASYYWMEYCFANLVGWITKTA